MLVRLARLLLQQSNDWLSVSRRFAGVRACQAPLVVVNDVVGFWRTQPVVVIIAPPVVIVCTAVDASITGRASACITGRVSHDVLGNGRGRFSRRRLVHNKSYTLQLTGEVIISFSASISFVHQHQGRECATQHGSKILHCTLLRSAVSSSLPFKSLKITQSKFRRQIQVNSLSRVGQRKSGWGFIHLITSLSKRQLVVVETRNIVSLLINHSFACQTA